jgi:ABC-type transport system involved in multi-copper enzyme maturation permease subunit
VAVCVPFVRAIPRWRLRRIWALARLSFKEAIRRRILWVFSILLLIFLFGSWFIPSKPEDQVRSYVQVVFWVMTFLLLLAAGLLASFSIPTDIRSQTIHTVLTKPVERFEIVLGRFLGYGALLSLVLVAASGLSLVYVLREVDPAAAEESLKARVPVYGELSFRGTEDPRRGENVGREWDYRSYIAGRSANSPEQSAIWEFRTLPRKLASRDDVRSEFTFDIYRTTKGLDYKPVACTFIFWTHNWNPDDPGRMAEYRRARVDRQRRGEPKLDDKLAEEYGYFEYPSKPIADYTTLFLDVPGGLFRNAQKGAPAGGKPQLSVRVRCEDRTQYVGMARRDFYFRLDDHHAGADTVWFGWNFFKGAFGIWLRLCLVLGVALACSTYLSAVISAKFTAFLYLTGTAQEFIRSLAAGTNYGGGPAEAGLRLFQGKPIATPLEETAVTRGAGFIDVVFRYALKLFLLVIPDVPMFRFNDFVAEGFNLAPEMLVLRLLVLAGYLLPCAVLAYYLLKVREVASSS